MKKWNSVSEVSKVESVEWKSVSESVSGSQC
jgi:hypothetical protein